MGRLVAAECTLGLDESTPVVGVSLRLALRSVSYNHRDLYIRLTPSSPLRRVIGATPTIVIPEEFSESFFHFIKNLPLSTSN